MMEKTPFTDHEPHEEELLKKKEDKRLKIEEEEDEEEEEEEEPRRKIQEEWVWRIERTIDPQWKKYERNSTNKKMRKGNKVLLSMYRERRPKDSWGKEFLEMVILSILLWVGYPKHGYQV